MRGSAIRYPLLNAIILGLAMLVSLPVAAFAHAAMVKSAPGKRAVLSQMPARIELCFNEAVEIKFSSVRIADRHETPLPLGELVTGSDPKCLEAAISPAGPGVYSVQYRVLSLDGHVIESSYEFTVKPALPAQQ